MHSDPSGNRAASSTSAPASSRRWNRSTLPGRSRWIASVAWYSGGATIGNGPTPKHFPRRTSHRDEYSKTRAASIGSGSTPSTNRPRAMPSGYATSVHRSVTRGRRTRIGALTSAPASTRATISLYASARARASRSGSSRVAFEDKNVDADRSADSAARRVVRCASAMALDASFAA